MKEIDELFANLKLFGIIILIFALLSGLAVSIVAIAKRSDDSDVVKKVKHWKAYEVQTSDTRVYCLARGIANGKFNLTELSIMIAEKNNLKNYAFYPGQKVLLPVFEKN